MNANLFSNPQSINPSPINSSTQQQSTLLNPPVLAFLHRPRGFSSRSGMAPMVEAVGAEAVFYGDGWSRLGGMHWRLARRVEGIGRWYSGSPCYTPVPFLDEGRLLRQARKREGSLLHFIWGEMSLPRFRKALKKASRGAVGTFHSTASRQPEMLDGFRDWGFFDHVTVMSATQIPYFLERGITVDRLHVILHGVDSDFFRPVDELVEREGALKGLLVGATERDHAFLAEVLKALPRGMLEMSILTPEVQRGHYRDAPGVRFLPRLHDDGLRSAYRDADLLVMPMRDCTANNVILEAMACGTPVMTTPVGGIPEYVSAEAGFVVERGRDAWVENLVRLRAERHELLRRRPVTRAWAERFDWRTVALAYRKVYNAFP